jgi:thiosulfate/3-mercaptopyruvate sulfurtransferase
MIYPLLVSTYDLQNSLSNPEVRIIDIRGQVPTTVPTREDLDYYEAYIQRHVPGAMHVGWLTAIMDTQQRLQVAKPEPFTEAMFRLGIKPDTFVIIYDTELALAARFWWTLNYYGHAKAAILNGGWRKWLEEKRPTTADLPHVTPYALSSQKG